MKFSMLASLHLNVSGPHEATAVRVQRWHIDRTVIQLKRPPLGLDYMTAYPQWPPMRTLRQPLWPALTCTCRATVS